MLNCCVKYNRETNNFFYLNIFLVDKTFEKHIKERKAISKKKIINSSLDLKLSNDIKLIISKMIRTLRITIKK